MNSIEPHNINSLTALSQPVINFWVCVSILIFGLLGVSCHHPDDPPPPPPVTEGKRNYTWTVDTLRPIPSGDGSQFLANGIWGTSPSNIYVVGWTDNNWGSVRHYDGNSWKALKVSTAEGGPLAESCEFEAVWGFGANDIWFAGSRDGFHSRIVHFDGAGFTNISLPATGGLTSIWGANRNDIWAGGASGTLNGGVVFHYDGKDWKIAEAGSSTICGPFAGFSNKDAFGIFMNSIPMPDSVNDVAIHMAHWDGASWTPIDSFTARSNQWKFGTHLWAGDAHQLFTSDYGVYQYLPSGTWQHLLHSDSNLKIGGSSNFNIFAAGDFGTAFHWNGTNWKQLATPFKNNCLFTGIWTNNVETFLLAADGLRSYVLHGK